MAESAATSSALTVVHQYYPDAISSLDFVLSLYRQLDDQFGLTPSDLMLAQSICSDDVNSIQFPEEGRAMLGPFMLGGLAGYPFTGLTGMSAFAHHIPDEGAALILHAPHIGINQAGELGKIRRIGHKTDSSCCGAALGALAKLQKGAIEPGPKSDHDYQQQTLEQLYYEQRERILASESPILETAEVLYEASAARIDELVTQTPFLGKYIVVIGGILINADWQAGSFLQIRRSVIYDAKTKEQIESLTF